MAAVRKLSGQAAGVPQEQLMLSGPSACRRAFPGVSCQLRVVRQWVASLLPDCPARDDVICVAAELAANAVQHTASGRDGHFEVGISWLDSAVRVTVSDSGSPNEPRQAGCLMAEAGRGLLIVNALALKTGVTGDAHGRALWADIPWNRDGTTGQGLGLPGQG